LDTQDAARKLNMRRIQILVGFIAILLGGCGRSDSTTTTKDAGANVTKDAKIDERVISEPFGGTWIEAQADGKSQGKLIVEPHSITWTRDECGAPETTVSTNYTLIDAKRVSFSASIVGSRGVFNPADKTEGKATIIISNSEQGLVLSVPEVKIDEGAMVRTLPPKTQVYTRKLQGGQATK
jgi:hypothetical protein